VAHDPRDDLSVENTVTTPTSPTPDAPRRSTILIESPARSLIWIAFWVLLGLVSSTLLIVIGPANWFPADQSYTAGKGAVTMIFLPIISLAAIISLAVGAVRRARPYREQQATAKGQQLQADMDDAIGRKPHVIMHIVGVFLAVIFGLALLFVTFQFTSTKVDAGDIVFDVSCLLILGIPAAATLSVALRRRAASRRVAARAQEPADSDGPTLI
jgi:hypothetical protein